MSKLTNERGKDVIYDESPHLIKITADCDILLCTDPNIKETLENYILDDKIEGGDLFQQ